MRGRKPTLKLHPEGDKVQPAPAIPDPPASMTGEALAEWDRVTPFLLDQGTIADGDRALLVLYCNAWAEYSEANYRLAEEGKVVKSPKGYPMLSMWMSVRKEAKHTILSIAAEFGLSALARQRLLKPKKAKRDAGKWEGLLANGG